jgi:hypothetical protein
MSKTPLTAGGGLEPDGNRQEGAGLARAKRALGQSGGPTFDVRWGCFWHDSGYPLGPGATSVGGGWTFGNPSSAGTPAAAGGSLRRRL